jgi:hypothetical protein
MQPPPQQQQQQQQSSSIHCYHQHHCHITLAVFAESIYVRKAHQRRPFHKVVRANGPVLVPSHVICTQFVMHSGSSSSSVYFHARPSLRLQSLYAGSMHQLRPPPIKSVHCVKGPFSSPPLVKYFQGPVTQLPAAHNHAALSIPQIGLPHSSLQRTGDGKQQQRG